MCASSPLCRGSSNPTFQRPLSFETKPGDSWTLRVNVYDGASTNLGEQDRIGELPSRWAWGWAWAGVFAYVYVSLVGWLGTHTHCPASATQFRCLTGSAEFEVEELVQNLHQVLERRLRNVQMSQFNVKLEELQTTVSIKVSEGRHQRSAWLPLQEGTAAVPDIATVGPHARSHFHV